MSMRNKTNIFRTLNDIETIQQSLIQFIRNIPMTDNERHFLDKQINHSNQAFEQIKTYLNQEEENWRG
jgi:hypothetical protein